MREHFDPPAWLTGYVALWMERLHLEEWDVHVRVANRIEGAPDADGFCQQYPLLNRAYLDFPAGIEDCAEDRIKVIHELLHVAHARIDRVVEAVIVPYLVTESQAMAHQAYSDTYESWVHRTATALYELMAPRDYPDEETGHAADHHD